MKRHWLVLLLPLLAIALVEGGLQITAAVLGPPGFLMDGMGCRVVPYVGHACGLGPRPGDFVNARTGDDSHPAVWMFGGSTMLHHDADRTIAAQLARFLEQSGQPRAVHNLGQPAYMLTQERILFEARLAWLPAPEVAIFYDGANQGVKPPTGWPHEFRQSRDVLERRYSRERFLSGFARSRFKIPFLLEFALNSSSDDESFANPFGAPERGERGPDVEDEARLYAHEVRLLAATCRDHGVICHFVWQPTVCFKPLASDAERRGAEWYCAGGKREALRAEVKRRVAALTGVSFLDISEIFRDTTTPLYLDNCHLRPDSDGNARIARALFERLFAPPRATPGA